MDRTTIINQLQELHHRTFDDDLLLEETFKDQGYDSLDFIEFAMLAEREFNMSLPDQELADVRTPNQLVDMIIFHTHLSQGADAIAPI